MKAIILALIVFISLNLKAQFDFERSDFINIIKNSSNQDLAWSGGMNFVQFSNIDLDYDGNLDLFVFDRSSNKILPFLHSGVAGTIDYTFAPEYISSFPELSSWALLRDYNCDGKMDIFAHTSAGIKLYKNTGDAVNGLSFELVESLIFTLFYNTSVNLYVSSADIPGIIDIDGDGDLDILTFGVSGSTVEYHKNYSMELYGVCDSLVYEMRNECWGRFTESSTTNAVNLWDTLVYPCDGSTVVNPELTTWPDSIGVAELIGGSRARHAGSTLMPFDYNGDGVMDLALGDVSYSNMVYVENFGTLPNTNSGMGFQDPNFPSNTNPVNVPIFPAGFYVDIDMDGKREMVVSPNATANSVDMQSVHHYLNNGTDNAPIFSFAQNDLFQDRMIEVGVGAYPVLFDHNGDGLRDLIVANSYYYNSTDQTTYSRLAYYQNTGTAFAPEFTFVTNDYTGLENTGLSLNIFPTFGDIDGDGDEDMYVGDLNGNIHFYENTAGSGNPAVYASPVLNVVDAAGVSIDVGQYATPVLKDMNRDGKLDLVIGCKIGTLVYYENTGTTALPKFTHQTDDFGNVNTTAPTGVYGYSVPSIVDLNGSYHLFCGAFSGDLHYYNNIDGNLTGTFNLVDSRWRGIQEDKQSGVAVADLDGDGLYELFYGTKRGGIALFESDSNVGLEDYPSIESDFQIYPNPANDFLTIDFSESKHSYLGQNIIVYNAQGMIVKEMKINNSKIQLDLTNFTEGIYILSIDYKGTQVNKKLIKL